MAANTRSRDRGVIQRGVAYPLQTFLDITGMGRKGLRDARASGLRVVYHSKNAYVSGDDFLDWIAKPERRTEPANATA